LLAERNAYEENMEDRMTKRLRLMTLVPTALAGALAAGGCTEHHHHQEEVVVEHPAPRVVEEREIIVEGNGPRPEPHKEVIIARPYATAVWHDGHWEHRSHPDRWVWVKGYWR
jgi:hypothetical protein